MKHKYEQRTEHTLEKDDRFYFYLDQFDKEISIAFHSSRNDVTDYTMSVEKFLKSLQQSIEDFDETELSVLKTTAAVLFGQIKKIESKIQEKVTI
mgnify:CR=1 FL=1|tara:strand:+ start:300 stop:584 length:285 start_codon:yes stop_codon:yes gene_type:complete